MNGLCQEVFSILLPTIFHEEGLAFEQVSWFPLMIDHQKHDQEPSWKINFHPAKTLHEKKKRKETLIWESFYQKKNP